jgi:hypothetical protein
VVSPDAKLKRQVCAALGQIAKHSVDLAEVVVEAEVFPNILMCLKDVDGFVRKHAATAIREVGALYKSNAVYPSCRCYVGSLGIHIVLHIVLE